MVSLIYRIVLLNGVMLMLLLKLIIEKQITKLKEKTKKRILEEKKTW